MANENREMAVVQASEVIGRRQKGRGKSRFANTKTTSFKNCMSLFDFLFSFNFIVYI